MLYITKFNVNIIFFSCYKYMHIYSVGVAMQDYNSIHALGVGYQTEGGVGH